MQHQNSLRSSTGYARGEKLRKFWENILTVRDFLNIFSYNSLLGIYSPLNYTVNVLLELYCRHTVSLGRICSYPLRMSLYGYGLITINIQILPNDTSYSDAIPITDPLPDPRHTNYRNINWPVITVGK